VRLFVYETHIPAWSSPPVLASRIAQWKQAKIETVFLLVDDGSGATWPSAICPVDPRVTINTHPLRNAVNSIRQAGMSVILVFNIIGIVKPTVQIHPEWYLQTGDYYNLWDEDFQTWRRNYIVEALEYADCDGIAFDYIRTGRPSLTGETPSDELVENFLLSIKRRLPFHLSMINISHTVYARPNSQGVNFARWYDEGIIESVLVYNYTNQFPFNDVAFIPQKALWILNSNYTLVNGAAVSKTKVEFESMCRIMKRRFPSSGYGIYNANLLTQDHVETLSILNLQEFRR
jgi:uncharacterized lipoprotein YddW (UPF0748 family)